MLRPGYSPIRAGGRPVEGDGEAVGRPNFAESERGPELSVDGKPAHADALGDEEVADELPVAVVSHAACDCRSDAQACQPRRDVAGEAAHEALVSVDPR